jgi:hypothetical protein
VLDRSHPGFSIKAAGSGKLEARTGRFYTSIGVYLIASELSGSIIRFRPKRVNAHRGRNRLDYILATLPSISKVNRAHVEFLIVFADV